MPNHIKARFLLIQPYSRSVRANSPPHAVLAVVSTLLGACLFAFMQGSVPSSHALIASTAKIPDYPPGEGTWSIATSEVPGGLSSVRAFAANDIWAAGTSGSSASTLTMHYDGDSWSQVASPSLADAIYHSIQKVDGTSGQDVWVVGYAPRTSTDHTHTFAMHWNGVQWELVDSPNPAGADVSTLYDVAAIAPDDVWAVGYSRTFIDNRPVTTSLILHWNGTQWSIIASPNPSSTYTGLNSVVALSSDNIWVTGTYYEGSTNYLMFLHYDGSSWSVYSSQPGQALVDMHSVSANDIWAVGGTTTAHWDGASWSIVPCPLPPEARSNNLHSVSGSGSNDVWAVGMTEPSYNQLRTLIMHWDGTQWRVVPSPNVDGVNNDLFGVWAVDVDTAWAVGPTMIARYTGGIVPTGTPTPQPCDMSFSDVHETDWFYSYVQNLYCKHVVGGYSDGTFRPNAETTRAQLSKILVLALSLDSSGQPQDGPHFQDVAPDSTFYPHVEAMSQLGVRGYPCGGSPDEPCVAPDNLPYFRPSNQVTRGQVAKMVVVAAREKYGWELLNPRTARFDDVPPISPFYQYVETAAARGVLSGYPCSESVNTGEDCPGTYFRPNNNATRAQVCKIIDLVEGS
jgi:hypothetical protein